MLSAHHGPTRLLLFTIMCFGILARCFAGDDEDNNAPPDPHNETKPQQPYPAPAPMPRIDDLSEADLSSAMTADPETHRITQAAIHTYLASKQDNGEIGGIGWWQVANGYSAIALHDTYTHNFSNAMILMSALQKCHHTKHDLINEFNDDSLWWGHALLDYHNLTVTWAKTYPAHPNLLSSDWDVSIATKIYNHVHKYQIPEYSVYIGEERADMGGAVLWTSRQGEDGANTISTSLFAELAARLALEVPATPADPKRGEAWNYIVAAERAVGWILREVWRKEDNVILDGIAMNKNDRCNWTFTYTTGQTIAALVAVAKAIRLVPTYPHQERAVEYMDTACILAKASLRRDIWVDENQVLVEHRREREKPWDNNDAWGFQSVLVRSMAKLARALKHDGWRQSNGHFAEMEVEVKRFIEIQYRAVRENDCSEDGRGSQYGPWWQGPFEAPTSHSQLSVLDVMAAIHAVRD